MYTRLRVGLAVALLVACGCRDRTSSKGVVGGPESQDPGSDRTEKPVVQAPADLICTGLDGGGARLSWRNPSTYAEIQISRNGVWIATLPGDATGFNDVSAPQELCRYRVNGVGTDGTAAATCEISLRPVAPVGDLRCSANGMDVTLAWRNGGAYSAIEIRRDGARVATLAGTATSWGERAPSSGTRTYAVRGLDEAGSASPASSCAVEVRRPQAPPIEGLVCGPDGLRILLSWRAPGAGSYQSIHVLRDGESLAQLDATASSYADELPATGTYAYTVEGRIDGGDPARATCTVTVEGLPPVEAVECAVEDHDVFLTWALPDGASYAAIEVLRDGEVVATLAADATSWSETVPEAGNYRYEVRGTTALLPPSEAAGCDVSVDVLPPVADLACALLETRARLTWSIPQGASYTSILVRRGGAERASLDGDATSFEEALEADGRYAYEVVARQEGVEDAEASACEVELLPVAPVEGLTLRRQAETVDLSWTLAGTYDAIRVLRGEALLAELEGTATTFRDTLPGPGLYRYAVIPRSGEREGEAATADMGAGTLVWEANAEPDLAGYNLYVADPSGSYPDKASPSLILGWRTSVPLEELLEGGIIEAGDQAVVLAAYDTSGNVSDFSGEVAFSYRVEIGSELP